MLNTLRLINFRRHVDTELDFTDDAQIIAITGRNGAGKSTVLEAILYALYGESRHGRRGLAKLVRRGAEFEGMQVELAFTVGGLQYSVVRRYDRGKSTAKLRVNGTDAMESPDGVTGEITRVLGMDATGFKLAVIAQQGDVDGLADLKPAVRAKTITRLLRQDALTRAAQNARDMHNRELDIWRAMGAGPDLEELEQAAEAARTEAAEAAQGAADIRAALVSLDAELAATAAIESAWQQAQIVLARADATATAARAEADRVSAELADVHIPDEVPAPRRPLAEITVAISEVNVEIATAQAARELAETAAATRADLDRVEKRLGEIAELLGKDTPATVAMALTRHSRTVEEINGRRESAQGAYDDLRAEHTTTAALLRELAARTESAEQLGDVCDACEQPISEEHKHAQAERREAEQQRLQTELARIAKDGQRAAEQVRAIEQEAREAQSAREDLIRRRGAVESACQERQDLERRKAQYTARLDRINAEPVDLGVLFARKGELEIEKAQAEQAEQVARVRQAALERQDRLNEALAGAQARLEDAEQTREAAAPDADLTAAHERRAGLVEQRAGEADIVAAVEAEAAAAAERVNSAQRAIVAAQSQHAKALEHRRAADKAAKTSVLLSETAAKLATLIRPALEGEISSLLQQLSDGRFTAVQVSDDYEIKVQDDGRFESLSEFSGGERVLIALAVRLALANVVADRHGSGGSGFLILDEVFGSQDESRRGTILHCLRALRGMYGQILLISHVGGMEDAADRVLEVASAEAEGRRVAEVAAA